MARYTGPRVKKMRALGIDLPGLSRKTRERRPFPPGPHGNVGRRKLTEFGRRLQEKQKLRFNYGVSERQLRRLFSEAKRSKTTTGDKLIELLESRLDNVVFRIGLAPTIPAGRQLVNHGHVCVNGKRVDIASYRVKRGDVITLRERSKKLDSVAQCLERPSLMLPEWIEFDKAELTANIVDLPDVESIPFPIEIQLVIEFYAKSL